MTMGVAATMGVEVRSGLSAKQKERERLGMSKRMKHLGMVEELAPYGMTNSFVPT